MSAGAKGKFIKWRISKNPCLRVRYTFVHFSSISPYAFSIGTIIGIRRINHLFATIIIINNNYYYIDQRIYLILSKSVSKRRKVERPIGAILNVRQNDEILLRIPTNTNGEGII